MLIRKKGYYIPETNWAISIFYRETRCWINLNEWNEINPWIDRTGCHEFGEFS